MTELNFKLIYYFMNENIILTEVKRIDLDEKKDPSKIYSWIKIDTSTQEIESLIFKSMSKEIINENEINVRTFFDGELRFDKHFAKFQYKGAGQILMNCLVEDVPDLFISKINSYLNP